jgi:hypothetical protein
MKDVKMRMTTGVSGWANGVIALGLAMIWEHPLCAPNGLEMSRLAGAGRGAWA